MGPAGIASPLCKLPKHVFCWDYVLRLKVNNRTRIHNDSHLSTLTSNLTPHHTCGDNKEEHHPCTRLIMARNQFKCHTGCCGKEMAKNQHSTHLRLFMPMNYSRPI